jgi:hypothetical protein
MGRNFASTWLSVDAVRVFGDETQGYKKKSIIWLKEIEL